MVNSLACANSFSLILLAILWVQCVAVFKVYTAMRECSHEEVDCEFTMTVAIVTVALVCFSSNRGCRCV